MVVDPHGRAFVALNAGSSLEVFGVGSYSDPELYVPGRLEVTPDPLDRDTARYEPPAGDESSHPY